MKKAIWVVAFLFFYSGVTLAQSPVINEFRQIISQRDTHFKSLQKEILQDQPDKGLKIYSSLIGESAISKSVIAQSTAEGASYMIGYNIESMNEMKLRIFSLLVDQYMAELNEMVKSGNYKGRDFQNNGESITELTDLSGSVVAQYISNPTDHLLIIFGK